MKLEFSLIVEKSNCTEEQLDKLSLLTNRITSPAYALGDEVFQSNTHLIMIDIDGDFNNIIDYITTINSIIGSVESYQFYYLYTLMKRNKSKRLKDRLKKTMKSNKFDFNFWNLWNNGFFVEIRHKPDDFNNKEYFNRIAELHNRLVFYNKNI